MKQCDESCVLAIDAGGTFFKSMLISKNGEGLRESYYTLRVNSDGPAEQILAAYKNIVDYEAGFARKAGLVLDSVAVATPGPFDYKEGISLMTHKFKSIYGYNLKKELRLYSNCNNISFMHDVLAFLAGEVYIGSGKGYDRIAAIVIGTGVAMACMINGQLLKNDAGGSAVSIFSRKVHDGVTEDYVSKRGIINLYDKFYMGDKAEIANIEVKDIAQKAREQKDEAAIKAFYEAGYTLGLVLNPIVDEYDLQCLIFGGQISNSLDLMMDGLLKGLSEDSRIQEIIMGKNIETSTLIGSAIQNL